MAASRNLMSWSPLQHAAYAGDVAAVLVRISTLAAATMRSPRYACILFQPRMKKKRTGETEIFPFCKKQEQLGIPGANPDEIDAQGKTVLIHAAAQVMFIARVATRFM
jgi:ankyrin repeat protein